MSGCFFVLFQISLTRDARRARDFHQNDLLMAKRVAAVLALASSAHGFVAPHAYAIRDVRGGVPVANTLDAAKAAWLASLDESRSSRPTGAPAAAAAPVAATPVDGAWLTPGLPVLTLEAADEMSTVALREAYARSFKPVSVCVMDASGRIIVSKTMIACATLAPELAQAKARTCVGFHISSRDFRDNYISAEGTGPKMPQVLAMGAVGASARQPVASFPGGVLCRDAAGHIIGAIGVSGAASDEDEHCAILGAHAVGLVTEPANSRLS